MATCFGTPACASTLSMVQGLSVLKCFTQEATLLSSGDARTSSTKQEQPTYSVVELMKLPIKERLRILASTAAEAEAIYAADKRLTDFEAFGEDDLYNTAG